MSIAEPPRFQLDPVEFLRAITGHVGVLGSPIPDSVSRRSSDTEASSGSGGGPPSLSPGAAVVSGERA